MEVFLIEGKSPWLPRSHGKPLNPMAWHRTESAQAVKRYQCKWCTCSYGRKEHLTRHEKNIHGEDAGPFICNFCQRTYKNAESLRSHQYQSHNPTKAALSTNPSTTEQDTVDQK